MPQPYPLPGGGQAGYRSRAVAVRPARVALTSVAVEPISEHVQVRGGIPWRPGNPMNSLEEKRKLADPGRSTGLESGGLRKPRALERRNTTRAAATNRTRRSPRVTSRAVVILRNRPSSYADVLYEAARKKLSDCRLISNQQFVRVRLLISSACIWPLHAPDLVPEIRVETLAYGLAQPVICQHSFRVQGGPRQRW